MLPLNPLSIKLNGLHLIEASAGTGKTYTLTTLYLRLLLERGLHPQSILVVTFTKAATEALRERVRSRIVTALAQLEATAEVTTLDPELAKLLENIPNSTQAKKILTAALAHIDEAAIYTIHSFCQQILQDYAFESGTSFTDELIADETNVLMTAAADVWRLRLAAASMEDTAWIISQWSDPWELLSEIQPTLNNDELRILPQLTAHEVRQEVTTVLTRLNRIRAEWPQVRDTLLDMLADNPSLHKTYYKKEKVQKAIAEMDRFATVRHLSASWTKCIETFQAEMILQRTLKHKLTPQHPFFNLCNEIDAMQVERANQHWRAVWFQEARQHLQDLLHRAKAEQELLSFDDLLKTVDTVLNTGTAKDTLAAIIRARFPVALIDEFQDTDPKQYRIFRRIYESCPQCGMFLIGDPKQAIYAFRGADVFTYMQARTDAVSQHAEYTLDTNWRSNSRLVTAVNTLFANASNSFLYKDIPFHAVNSSAKADTKNLIINGNSPVPLQFWIIESPAEAKLTVATANSATARACAEYIAWLLQAADAGSVKIGKHEVRSKDIAVLVRSHREGELMQQALNACNVGCATLSQDSIFTTEQAEELSMVLSAVARNDDMGILKAALATRLLGWKAQQLEILSHNAIEAATVMQRFQEYYKLWLERGFIIAFQQLLVQENIPSQLLQAWDGERWLTNVLQLGELLQEASVQYVKPSDLLYWFDLQRNMEQTTDESRQMRLESDASLVQVITMHKSKGLEYPIVFIPFPWSLKPHRIKNNAPILFHDETDFMPHLDLGTDTQLTHKSLQNKEDLAEQVRLFYVAVTRAVHLCVLCWGAVNQAETSAPAWLLHPDRNSTAPVSLLKNLTVANIKADLEHLATNVPNCIQILDLPTPTGIRWQGTTIDPTQLHAAKFTGIIDNRWIVASYSGLTRNDESLRPDYDGTMVASIASSEEIVDSTNIDPLLIFPAGAESGLFLHTILERLDFSKATPEILHTAIHNLLPSYNTLRHNPPPGLQSWEAIAVEMITNCLTTPLASGGLDGLRLKDVSWNNRLSELEFHYPIANLTPTRLHTALVQFPAYSDSARGLEFKSCEGLMHGFIDLIFRHHNRYYLVDYKSNRLGMNIMDYNHSGMSLAMRLHRYDLQYLIYTVAVHRFLQQRLPNYNYKQHFGGVLYLFLRGMRPHLGADYGVYFDRPEYQVIKTLEEL